MSPTFNPNNQFQQQNQEQLKRFQEQQRQQQEQWHRQQEMGAHYEMEKKRKAAQIQNAVNIGRQQAGQPALRIQGGVNIRGVGDVNVGGDIVGRDKEENINVNVPVEEKSGCAFAIERTAVFVFGWLIGGAVLGALVGGAGALLFMVIGSEDSAGTGFGIGAVLGVILAFGLAIAGASNVKRTKG